MKGRYLVAVVVAGLLNGFSCSFAAITVPSTLVNASCSVIESSLFQLDLNCIKRLNIENIQNISAPTSKYCSSFYHCKYDIFYWDRSQRCVAMSYNALKLCPLMLVNVQSPLLNSMLFLDISQKMPSEVKQRLYSHGYRYKIAQLLDCHGGNYLCNDFTCVDWKFRCDGIVQCPDKSDEISCYGTGKCLGQDGKYYDAGQEYVPLAEADGCKICICGSDGMASYCYSPLCTAPVSCTGAAPDICCKCFGDTSSQSDPNLLGYSQRLLVSCVAVLFIIAIILILSRGLSQHSLRRQANRRLPDPSWIAMASRGLPPNRSFFENNSVHPFGVDFFDRNSVPDVPPPYTLTKPETPETGDAPGAPPSYEDSTVNAELPDDAPPSPRHESGSSESTPVSPLSTTSDCPLLRNATATTP